MSTMKSLRVCLTRSYPLTRNVIQIKYPHSTRQNYYKQIHIGAGFPSCGHRKCRTIAAHLKIKVRRNNQSNVSNVSHSSKGNSILCLTRKNKLKHAHRCMKLTRNLSTNITEKRPNPNAAPNTNSSRNNLSGSENSMASLVLKKLPISENNKNKTSTNESKHETDNCSMPSFGEFLSGEHSCDLLVRKESLVPVLADFQLPSIAFLLKESKGCRKLKHAHHCMKLTRNLSTNITENRPNPNAAPDTNSSRKNLSGTANSMSSLVLKKSPTSENNTSNTSTNEWKHEMVNYSMPSFGEFLSGEYSCDPLVRRESLVPLPEDFQLPSFAFLLKESEGCRKLKHAHHCMKLTRNLSTNITENRPNPNAAPNTNSSRNNLSGSANSMSSLVLKKLPTSENQTHTPHHTNKTSTNEFKHEMVNCSMPSFGEFLNGEYSCDPLVRKESLVPVPEEFQLPSLEFLSEESKGCRKLKHAHHCMKLTRNLSTNITENRPNPNAAPDTNSPRNNLSASANSMASLVLKKLPTSENNKNKTSTNESKHETDNRSMPSFGELLNGEYSGDPLVRRESLVPVPEEFQLPSLEFLSEESKGRGKLEHAHHCMKLTRNLSTNISKKSPNSNAAPDKNSSRINLFGPANTMASFVHNKLPTSENNKNKTSTNKAEHGTDNRSMPSFGEILSGEYSCDPLVRLESLVPVVEDFHLPSFAFFSKESKGCGIFRYEDREETVSTSKNHKEPEPFQDGCLNKISESTGLDSKPVLCQNFNHPDTNFVEKMSCDHDLLILNKDSLKCFMAPKIAKDEDLEQISIALDLKSDSTPSPDSINTGVLWNVRNEMEILGNTPSDCIWKNLEVAADIKEGNDISEPAVNVNVGIIPIKCAENNDFTDDLTKIKTAKIEKIPYQSPHSNSILNSVDKSAEIIQKDLYISSRNLDSLKKNKAEDKKNNPPEIELLKKLDFDSAFELDLCHKVRPHESGLSDNITILKTIKKPDNALNSFKNYMSAVPTNSNNKCPEIQKRKTHCRTPPNKPPDQTNPTVNTSTKTVIASTKSENRTEISVQKVEKFVDKRTPFPFCAETVFQVFGSNEKLGESINAIESSKAKLATLNSENSKNSLPSQSLSFKNMLSSIKSGSKKSEDKSVVIPTEDVNSEPNSGMSVEEFAKKTKHTELMRLARAINAKIKMPSSRQYDIASTRLPAKRTNLRFRKGINRLPGTDNGKRPFREFNERIKLMTPKQIDAILGIKPKSGNENEKLKLQIRVVDKDKKTKKVVVKPRKPVDKSTEIKQGITAKPMKDDKLFVKKEESKPIMKLLPLKITDVKTGNKMKTDTISKSNDKTKIDDKDENLSASDCQILKKTLVSKKNDREKPSIPNSTTTNRSNTPKNNEKQLFSPIVKPPKSGGAVTSEIRIIKGEKEIKKEKEDVEQIIELIKAVQNKTIAADKLDPKLKLSKPIIDTKRIVELFKAKIDSYIKSAKAKMEVPNKSPEEIKAESKTEIRSGNPQANIAESIESKNVKLAPNLNTEIELTSQNKSAVDSKTDPKMEAKSENFQQKSTGSDKGKSVKSDPNVKAKIQLTSQNKSAADSKTDPKMEVKSENFQQKSTGSDKGKSVKSDPNVKAEIQLTSQNKSAADSKTDPKMEVKSENFQQKSTGSDKGKSVKSDPNVKAEIQLTSQNKSTADSKADPTLEVKSKDSQKKNTGSFKGKNVGSDPNLNMENQLTSENKTEKPIPDTNIVTKESTDAKMTELNQEKQEASKTVKFLKEFTKIPAVKDKLDTKNNVKEPVKEVTKSSRVKDKLDTKNNVKEPVKEVTKSSEVKDKLDTKNNVKESVKVLTEKIKDKSDTTSNVKELVKQLTKGSGVKDRLDTTINVKEPVKELTKSSVVKDKLDTTNNAKEPVKSSPAPKPTPRDKPHGVTKSERLTVILPKKLVVTHNKLISQISESEGQAKLEPKIITRTLIEKIKKAPMESPIFTAASTITESEKELSKKINKSLFQSKSSKQIELIEDFYLGKLDTSLRHPEVLLLKAKKSFAETKKQASKIAKNDEKFTPSSPQTKSRGNLGSIPKQSVHTLNTKKVDIPQPLKSTQGSIKTGKQISPTIVTSTVPLPESLKRAMSKIHLESSKSIQTKETASKAYKPTLKEELAMSKIQLEPSKPIQISGAKLKDDKPALKEDLAMNKIQLDSSKPIQIKGAELNDNKPELKEDLAMNKIQLDSSKPIQIKGAELKENKEDLAVNKIQLDSPKPIQIRGAELKDNKPELKEDLAMNKIQLDSSKPIQIKGAESKDNKPELKEDLAMNKIQLNSSKPIQIKGAELKENKEDLAVNKIQLDSPIPIQIKGAKFKENKEDLAVNKIQLYSPKPIQIKGAELKDNKSELKEDLAMNKIQLDSPKPIQIKGAELKDNKPELKEDLAMDKIQLDSPKHIQIKRAELKDNKPELKKDLAVNKIQLDSPKPIQIRGAESKNNKPELKEDLAMNKIQLDSPKPIQIKGAELKDNKPELKEDLAMDKIQLDSPKHIQIKIAELKDNKPELKKDLAVNKIQLYSPKPIQIKGAESKDNKPELKEDLAVNKVQLESSKPIQINGDDSKAYMKPSFKESKFFPETPKIYIKEDLDLHKFKEYVSALKNSITTANYVLPCGGTESVKTRSSTISPSLQPIKSSISPSLGKLNKTAEMQKKIKDRNCDLTGTFAEQEISKTEAVGFFNQNHSQSLLALHHFEGTQKRLDDDLKRMQQKLSKFETEVSINSLKDSLSKMTIYEKGKAVETSSKQIKIDVNKENKKRSLSVDNARRATDEKKTKVQTNASAEDKRDALDRAIKENILNKMDLKPLTRKSESEDHLIKTNSSDKTPELIADSPPISSLLSLEDELLKTKVKEIWPPLIESPSIAKSQLPERDFIIDFDKVGKESIPSLDIRMCKICPTPEHRILSFPLNNIKKKHAVHNSNAGVLSINPNKNIMLKKALTTLPSVTTILNSTMCENSKLQMTKWKSSISQMGEDGFKKLYSEELQKGNEFHGSIHAFLKKFKEPGEDVNHYTRQYFKSIKDVLKNISDVSVIDSLVVHPQLAYRGVIDCVAKYKNKNVIIEWKRSDKSKPTIRHTFDAPLQLSAYIGALSFDPAYDMKIEGAVVVVAHSDGTPADVINMSLEECESFWKKWLLRHKHFFANHQGFPFRDVK